MDETPGRKNVEGLIGKPVMLYVRLSQQQKDRLGEEAREQGMQLSEYVRFILVTHFKKEDQQGREDRAAGGAS